MQGDSGAWVAIFLLISESLARPVGAGRQPDGLIMGRTTPHSVRQELSHTGL